MKQSRRGRRPERAIALQQTTPAAIPSALAAPGRLHRGTQIPYTKLTRLARGYARVAC